MKKTEDREKPVVPKGSIEERWAKIEARVARADTEFRDHFYESMDMSWIFHDRSRERSTPSTS
jgi:hypothetical protein